MLPEERTETRAQTDGRTLLLGDRESIVLVATDPNRASCTTRRRCQTPSRRGSRASGTFRSWECGRRPSGRPPTDRAQLELIGTFGPWAGEPFFFGLGTPGPWVERCS